jgi:enediyne biosynthesis protein E4
MNKGKGLLLALMGILLLAAGCRRDEKMLFKTLSAGRTGVDFVNQLDETDTFNILDTEYMYNGGGVGVGDFNNDGLMDLYFTASRLSNRMYLNRGNFRFDDITEVSGTGTRGIWSSGVTVVDLNGDGWLDLYVSATMSDVAAERRNLLFINQGPDDDGVPVFREEAAAWGIADDGHSTHSVFLDYDGDGDLDLYVLTNVLLMQRTRTVTDRVTDGSSPTTDRLYRNNGDGTFTEVSREAGILIEGFGLGVSVLDVNRDHRPDIYVTNDFITNDLLWVNNGDGTFSNRIADYIQHQSYSAMGHDVADINDDGFIDIITLDMLPTTNQRVKQMFNATNIYFDDLVAEKDYEIQYIRNCVQLNNGNGTFSEVGMALGLHDTDWSWSILFADYNNDGLRDVSVTNGFPRDLTDHDFSDFRSNTSGAFATLQELLALIPVVEVRNHFFRYHGDYRYEDVSEFWGITELSFTNGASFVDLDNDGDLDFVANNINKPAYIFRNRTSERFPDRHWLRLRLKGTPINPDAYGAKVWLRYGGRQQYHEHNLVRGYASSVEPVIHFGLGEVERVDTLIIRWPDGRQQLLLDVPVDQVLALDHADGAVLNLDLEPRYGEPLFAAPAGSTGLDFVHTDPKFLDFVVQRLNPHLHSQEGPGLAVADVNGDGLDDLFAGNGRTAAGMFYLQNPDGSFRPQPLNDTVYSEDTGVLLFDADNDGDADLYIGSGSSEFKAGAHNLKDRFYRNQGGGKYVYEPGATPDLYTVSSIVTAADFDRDGDLDIFVGGRVLPQSYPMPVSSAILENRNGVFVDATERVCPALRDIGMVTSALWTDADGDGWVDLLLVGEWMPVRLFLNRRGVLEEAGPEWDLGGTEGWWRSIISVDVDRDGDLDYVLGNQGLNNKIRSTPERPVLTYAKDFDNNGAIDNVMGSWREGNYYPVHLKIDIEKQLAMMRRKFPKFRDYGSATFFQLFEPEDLEGVYAAEARYFESVWLENAGGRFILHKLPMEAQFAPVKGMLAGDFDGDLHPDLLMVGNNYGTELQTGRHDALIGLMLRGDGAGGFRAVSVLESGFYVPRDAGALVSLARADGRPLIVAGRNRDSLAVLEPRHPDAGMALFRPEPLEYSFRIYYRDGRIELRESCYGQSHLSAPTRAFWYDPSVVDRIIARRYDGQEREVRP